MNNLTHLTRRWTEAALPFVTALMLVAGILTSHGAVAAELLMLEQKGCAYCEKFDREIAPAYPNTAEGKTAPLRRIDIDEKWPEDLAGIKPSTVTPTFILIDNNQESGRLYGYNGDEYFWFLLGELLDNLQSDLSTKAK